MVSFPSVDHEAYEEEILVADKQVIAGKIEKNKKLESNENAKREKCLKIKPCS